VPHLLVAPDKFRGTASSLELVQAALGVAGSAGWSATGQPLSDGGEGLVDALGGELRTAQVTGPLGQPVEARWSLRTDLEPLTAVVEMAQASGLLLAGGASANNPLAATTRGTGELILAAVAAGALRVVVGCGGSATTDGGSGALEAIGGPERLQGSALLVACDVTTRFLDAARVFGPQKGAGAAQVAQLSRRLDELAHRYQARFGVDVRELESGGAAGGLAGGLAALGARLVPGIDLVADLVDLDGQLSRADLVVTGEGRLDHTSLQGKTVTGVLRRLRPGTACLLVVGQRDPGLGPQEVTEASGTAARRVDIVSLAERFSLEAAMTGTCALFAEVVAEAMRAG
jgi:glycerate 2-kinase